MNAKSNILTLTDVHKVYNEGKPNEIRALDGVSLAIKKGDFVAIIGPSGSGKSTLMHVLGILDYPTSGTISINDRILSDIPRSELHTLRGKEIGFVFQGFNLLSTVTAVENVAEAALYQGIPRREATRRATELLTQVGLADRLTNFPNELSGGQQQRVAIARAMINRPSIILADEPTGELDTKNAQAIMDLLEQLNRENNQTVIIVTHSDAVAQRARTVVSMVDGNIVSIEQLKNRS